MLYLINVVIIFIMAFVVSMMFASSISQPAKPEVGQRVRFFDEMGDEKLGKVVGRTPSKGTVAKAIPRLDGKAQYRMAVIEAQRAQQLKNKSEESTLRTCTERSGTVTGTQRTQISQISQISKTDSSVLVVDTKCFYRKRDGTEVKAEVKEVHDQVLPPIYTIRVDATEQMPAHEQKTFHKNLRPRSLGTWPEELVPE